MMKLFKVIDGADKTEVVLNGKELKELARYYYNNSDITEEIDLRYLDNAIKFVERVDQVIPINKPIV